MFSHALLKLAFGKQRSEHEQWISSQGKHFTMFMEENVVSIEYKDVKLSCLPTLNIRSVTNRQVTDVNEKLEQTFSIPLSILEA